MIMDLPMKHGVQERASILAAVDPRTVTAKVMKAINNNSTLQLVSAVNSAPRGSVPKKPIFVLNCEMDGNHHVVALVPDFLHGHSLPGTHPSGWFHGALSSRPKMPSLQHIDLGGKRASWVLIVKVGTQDISPLRWAIESGSLSAAKAIIEDLLTIRLRGSKAVFTRTKFLLVV